MVEAQPPKLEDKVVLYFRTTRGDDGEQTNHLIESMYAGSPTAKAIYIMMREEYRNAHPNERIDDYLSVDDPITPNARPSMFPRMTQDLTFGLSSVIDRLKNATAKLGQVIPIIPKKGREDQF
jgi:hypothetical protein